jgi:hypothetical protein
MSDDKLSIYSQFGDPIQAMQHIGKIIASSGMFGVKSEAQGQVLALMCMSERKSPLAVIREFHITSDGRIIKRAERMHADFQKSGGRIQWIISDDTKCEAIFFHDVHAPSGVTCSCTIEQAAKAGVTGKGPWKNFPKRMLQCWVIREGIKQVLPDITSGFITEDLAEAAPFDEQIPHPQPMVKALPNPQPTANMPPPLQQKMLQESYEKTPSPSESKVISDRAKKVLNVFCQWGVAISDLEGVLGYSADMWGDEQFKILTELKKDIHAAGGEDHLREKEIEKVREIFNLSPGSVF